MDHNPPITGVAHGNISERIVADLETAVIRMATENTPKDWTLYLSRSQHEYTVTLKWVPNIGMESPNGA